MFKTLSGVFKNLQKYLLADLSALRDYYGPLLGHHRDFVREFAAHSFSFLLRKIQKPKQMKKFLHTFLFALVTGSARENENLKDGVAYLLFGIMKNVQHQFHSRTLQVLPMLLAMLRPKATTEDEGSAKARDALFGILLQCMQLMCEHTKKEHCAQVIECIQNTVDKSIEMCEQQPTVAHHTFAHHMMDIFLVWVRYRYSILLDVKAAYIIVL